MIILPTRKRLTERRDALYEYLLSIIQCASIHHIEDVIREIHIINNKLRTYFIRDHEPEEVFDNEDEENRIKAKNPFTINTLSQ